jgi:hypothetical protein
MAKHIAPPATAEQIMRTLGVTPEDREIIARVLKEVDEEEGALNLDTEREDDVLRCQEGNEARIDLGSSSRSSLWYSSPMAKHIAPPATYEQLTQSLALTPEEIELVDRVIEKVLKEEEEASRPGHGREGASFEAKRETKP